MWIIEWIDTLEYPNCPSSIWIAIGGNDVVEIFLRLVECFHLFLSFLFYVHWIFHFHFSDLLAADDTPIKVNLYNLPIKRIDDNGQIFRAELDSSVAFGWMPSSSEVEPDVWMGSPFKLSHSNRHSPFKIYLNTVSPQVNILWKIKDLLQSFLKNERFTKSQSSKVCSRIIGPVKTANIISNE